MDACQAIGRATERFLRDAALVTTTAWAMPPTTGRWSVSEIAEHVTVANGGVLAQLERLSPNGGATPSVLDDEIPFLFYRGDEPPDVAAPTGTWVDRHEALERLRVSADALKSWESSDDLRRLGAKHPVFGLLDGTQWLLFAAAHMERHRAQVVGFSRED